MTTPSPRLQIIRGLPGSGKTTIALKRYPHLMRLETDMFFYRQEAYRFTLENNKRAVKWFLKSVKDFCKCGFDFVVTGVFAAHTERLSMTIDTALDAGYEIWIKTLTTQHKGVHAVPPEHFNSMKAAFISERALRAMYTGNQSIYFGLMPKGTALAHIEKRRS